MLCQGYHLSAYQYAANVPEGEYVGEQMSNAGVSVYVCVCMCHRF